MNEHKTLAGALILAFASRSDLALNGALEGVRAYGNPVAVMLALADTAADLLVQLHGDGWQEALQDALIAAATEGVDGGAAELG